MTSEKFIELVEQYERFVFTICYQLVRDYQEAQNLAQDTFVSAFGHIDRVSEENLKAWFAAGVYCVGMGSKLFPSDRVAAGDWAYVADKCRESIAIALANRK